MLDIFEALNWLNTIDNSSHLSGEARRLFQQVSGFGQNDLSVRVILERLRNCAHSPCDPREKAEILLGCAAIGYWRGWHSQSASDAREALLCYEDDIHRHAVALWILGTLQWDMRENHDAYRNWADAIEEFRQRARLFQHFPKEISWYQNRIRHMEVRCAYRPEEIWTWLNYFERPSLRTPSQQVVDCVHQKIREHAYSNIYALMPDLQEATRRCEEIHERAEVYLEFGLGMYQMGNTSYAIELLRKSVLHFYPGVGTYHKQVAARCMLGALEWMQRSSQHQADADWTRCITELEKLRNCADQDNCQEKEEWYAQHRDILRTALFEKRKQNPRSPDINQDSTQPHGPTRSPATPDNETTHLYNELLMKVRWDRAIADRLIEFERKKSPRAGRREWIKRAIERWEHDNR